MRRRRRKRLTGWLVLIVLVGLFVVFLVSRLTSDPEQLVETFYEYESEAEFGKSWELMHSEMKKRFPVQADYIQNRSHVFLQHMEVATFSYEVGEAEKRENWTFSRDGTVHEVAYEVPVRLQFDSRFGVFTMEQSSFVVEEKGEWRLLWDYNF